MSLPYGTPSAPTSVAVQTTTTEALAANGDREYACFTNNSNKPIYLAFGNDAEMNKGIRLNAEGGSYEMSRELGNLYQGAVNAIAEGGDKVLCVQEGA